MARAPPVVVVIASSLHLRSRRIDEAPARGDPPHRTSQVRALQNTTAAHRSNPCLIAKSQPPPPPALRSAASTAGAPADLGFASLRGQFAVANTTAHRPTEPNLLGRAALRMLWPTLSLNLVTALVEMGIRLSTAVGLKYFLAAIVDPTRPARDGWLWGTFLVALSLAMMVTHHVLFFSGLAMGFRMRVAAMAMVYAKILRLNATALADISTGESGGGSSRGVWGCWFE